MDFLIRVAIILVITASAGGVGGYAYSIGAAVNTATAYGSMFGAVALLLFECCLAPMGGRALGRREFVAAGCYFALLFMLVLPVVTSLDVGFTSSLFSTARAARAVSVIDVTAIPKRSAAEVEAELKGKLLDTRLGGCAIIDGPVTKAACPAVAELRREWEAAKAYEAKTAGGVTVAEADPRADMLSRRTGFTPEGIADLLNVMTALAFAFARVAGCYYLFGHNAPVSPAQPSTAKPVTAEPPKAAAPILVTDGGKRLPVLVSLESLGAKPGKWHAITQRALATALGAPLSKANAALREAEAAGLVSVRADASGTQVKVA